MEPSDTLQSKLKALRPPLSDRQSQKALQFSQTNSFSSMLEYLLVDCNLQFNQITKMIENIVVSVRSQKFINEQLNKSFRFAWVKILLITTHGMDQQETVKIIVMPDTDLENGEINKFVIKSAEFSKKVDLENFDKIVSKIQNNADYILIKKIFSLPFEQKLKEKDLKQQESFSQLKQMKKSHINFKGSIIDELINENLIKSFEASISQNPSSIYSKDNFENFKNQLLQIVKKLKISDYDLISQLSSPVGGKDVFYQKIFLIRAKLHPIFIPELLKIVNRNCDIIKNQDIIAIFGDSGAGKTTTIQIMFGYKMAKVSSASQLETLVPIGGLKPEHKDFIAKASSKSVTKSISAAQLQLPNQFKHLGKIYLADTPGFNDSEGALVDVGNSLATLKVLRTASSVRFIFLLNQKNMGTRMEGLKKLTKLISQIFKKYNPKKVLYFMNRFSENDLQQMAKRIQQLIKQGLNPIEKGDSNFVAIINHFNEMMRTAARNVKNQKKSTMKEAISEYVSQMVVIDPLKPDLNEIYQKVMDEYIAVQDLANQLVTMVSPEAKQVLCSQSHKFQQIIQSFLRTEQFIPAIYYLNQLKQFVVLTQSTNDSAQAQSKYNKIIQSFQQQNKRKLKQFRSDLKDKIELLNVNQKVYEEAKKKMENLTQIEDIFKDQAESNLFKHSNQINKFIEQTNECLLTKVAQKQRSPRLILTIELFSKYFSPSLYSETIAKIKSQIAEINKKIKKSIIQQKYQNLAQALNEKHEIEQMKVKIQQESVDWLSLMNQKIKQRNIKVNDIFNKSQPTIIQKHDLEYTKQSLNIYSAQIDTNISQILAIVKYGQFIKKSIVNCARKCLDTYKKLSFASNNGQQALNLMSMENSKKILIQLRQINEVQEDVSLMIDQMQNKTSDRITQSLQNLQNQIHFGESNEQQKLNQIYRSILKLKYLMKLITDPTKSNQIKLKIQATQQKISKLITNFYQQQIKHLLWEAHKKQNIVSKLRQGCKIINVVLKNSSKRSLEETTNQIYKACIAVKGNIRVKLMDILGKTKQYITETMDGQKKQNFYEDVKKHIKNFQKLAGSLSKINRSQFSILSAKGEIKSVINQFQISLTHIVQELTQDIKQDIKKFIVIFENQDNIRVIKEREVRILEKKMNALNFFQQCVEFQHIFSQHAAHPLENYQQIQEELEILEKQIIQNYSQKVINQQKYHLQPILLQSCRNLKRLRGQFEEVEKSMKQKFINSSNDLDDNIDKYFHNDKNDFSIYEIKQRYDYYLKFGEDPKYFAKRSTLIQKLKYLIKAQQKNVAVCARQLIISPKKLQTFNKIEAYTRKIAQLLQKVVKCKEAVSSSVDSLQISQETISSIQSKQVQILSKYQRQIKTLISLQLNISLSQTQLASTTFIQSQLMPNNNQSKSQSLQNIIQNYEQILSCFQLIDLNSIKEQVRNKKMLFEDQSVMEYYARILTEKNSDSSGQKQNISMSSSYEKDQNKYSSSGNISIDKSQQVAKSNESDDKIKQVMVQSSTAKYQPQAQIKSKIMADHNMKQVKQDDDDDLSEVLSSLKQKKDESMQEVSKNQDEQQRRKSQINFKESSIVDISGIYPQEKKQISFQQKASFQNQLLQAQASFNKALRKQQENQNTQNTSNTIRPLRTIFLLANTPTMKNTLQMFRKCLDQAVAVGAAPNRQYQYKVMFVRNYNSKIQDIFSQSQFSSDIKDVYKFCKKTTFIGGYPTLALEYAFNKINQIQHVDQVIMFVNKRSNLTNQIKTKMETFGNKYWKDLKVSIISDAEQLQKMRKKGISVHCLYFESDEYFQGVSKTTNGVAEKVQKSQNMSHQVMQFIANRLQERS